MRLELINEYGNVLSKTHAYLVVDEELNEPLITDTTIDELEIQVISFGKGLWRHKNDPPGKIRESVHKKRT